MTSNALESIKSRLIPERYLAHQDQIDRELKLFSRFEDRAEYFVYLVQNNISVSNVGVDSWVAWAIGLADQKPAQLKDGGVLEVTGASPPDIDLDFSHAENVFNYVRETYGDDYVARVGSFQNLKTKAALKAIWRNRNGGTLPPDHFINKLCRQIKPPKAGIYTKEIDYVTGFTDKSGEHHPGLMESNPAFRAHMEQYPDVYALLQQLLQKPTALGQHAAGICVSPFPIDMICPTRRIGGGIRITQVDKKRLEKLGLQKIDALNLKTLEFIFGAKALIRERRGIDIGNPFQLPDDPAVYERYRRNDTISVFQFDSPVVAPLLAGANPRSISDLSMITAVGRPGCLDSKMEDGRTVAEHFIARASGAEPVTYLDPILEPILRDSYGIVVYQESIQRIFEVVGGFTPLESDNGRRAVSSKNLALMDSIRQKFFDGAARLHGWSTEKTQTLWNSFVGAANYAFNAGHSTAYAIDSYACMWLRHHYPLEWWCAVLRAQDNPDKLQRCLLYLHDQVDLPHVNRSRDRWVITEHDHYGAPLNLVTGVGPVAAASIIAAAPYGSVRDYWNRSGRGGRNSGVFTALASAGCFDGIPLDEGRPWATLEELLDFYYNIETGPRAKRVPVDDRYKNLNERQLLFMRIDLTGIYNVNYPDKFIDYFSSLPVTDFRGTKGGLKYLTGVAPVVEDFSRLPIVHKSYVGFVGIIGRVMANKEFTFFSRRDNETKKAIKLTVENMGSEVECVIWPNVRIIPDQIAEGKLVALYGKLKLNDYSQLVDLVVEGNVMLP